MFFLAVDILWQKYESSKKHLKIIGDDDIIEISKENATSCEIIEWFRYL